MDVLKTFEYQLVKWLIDNNITNIDVNLGIRFDYYNNTHIIECSPFIQEKVNKELMRFFYEYGCKHNISFFTMAFLHEVGHALTLSSFTEKEYKDLMDTIEMANEAVKLNPKEKEYFNFDWYWHMPHEFAANIWAINFINNHFDKIYALEKIVETNLNIIYNDNNIIAALNKLLEQSIKEKNE